jgi:dTDP-4-dehydrorhamnose reductase
MTPPPDTRPAIEVWGGVECTVNRVGNQWFDQQVWSGHQHRVDDLDRFAELGIKALRYPVLWERVAPHSLDEPDFAWSDERFARLRTLGLRPIAGLLHHGSGPAYTSLMDPAFPELLARYARMVAERYPWVTDFTPVNEPLTTARFSGLYGFWYPHLSSAPAFVRTLLAQLRGVVLAMRAIREVTPAARLVQTEDCGATFGTPVTAPQVEHEAHRRWLTWDLLTGRVDRTHALHAFLKGSGASDEDLAFFVEHPCPPEVLGLNYYLTSDRYLDHRLERYSASAHGGNDSISYADVEAVRARDEGIVGHHGHLMAAWARYAIPVALTEVHLSCTRDEQVRWLVEAWSAARRARDDGADVRAVTAWALLGSHEWNSLVTRRQGHYESGVFDARSDPPRATHLASVVAELASGRVPDHPVLDRPGWWRRPQRLLHRAGGATGAGAPSISGRQMLITGAGTLGRAFQRVCETRGLPARVASRQELDISSPGRVDAALRHLRPWAVINAAGYVRVDDAETEPAACRRANVAGAVTLAAACHRLGIPLVTFSSDLVFDGESHRPYLEHDPPRPLNVYGRSKAQAEQRVLAVLPTALVIRTSAFFGPWDDANFAAHVVMTLLRGEPFPAAEDSVVSPTYVPDLVNTALDLLIDGENGLYHVANAGAVTWFEFARAIAVAWGLGAGGIVAARGVDTFGPARRPANSALGSARGNGMRPLDQAIAAFVADAAQAPWLQGARTCASS